MLKLKPNPERHKKYFPKHLIWVNTFEFTFEFSMDNYVDRIKILMNSDLSLSLSNAHEMKLYVSRRHYETSTVWLTALIQDVDQTSVRVVGKTGLSRNELIWLLGSLFVVMFFAFIVGFGTSLGFGWAIVFGVGLYLALGTWPILTSDDPRSALMDDIRRAGTAER
ncbi:MAG: DUF485 domain-containing protein [Bacteroidales bacterium]|nr:DUF485 domain-containing protein [Bacteroidales bacterium]